MSIFDQLQLEEALLRVDTRNFCILNHNASRAIVMGISGKEHELIDIAKVQEAKIPVIRRFSGGGTVITDASTLFSSFIFNHTLLDISPFPESILQWSADFYRQALGIKDFGLKEHDYVINNHKCGGNAQYLRKDRFVHHSTFLWDYSEKNMSYLLLPKKMPTYRQNRTHENFLCTIKPWILSIDEMKYRIIEQLKTVFDVKIVSLEELKTIVEIPHRKTTCQLSFESV